MGATAGSPTIIRSGSIFAQLPEIPASGSSPMSRLPLGASFDQSRASRNCWASSRPDDIAADRLDIAAIEPIQRNSRHADRFDVQIIDTDDHPFLAEREGQAFLRDGERRVWRYDDLQSF